MSSHKEDSEQGYRASSEIKRRYQFFLSLLKITFIFFYLSSSVAAFGTQRQTIIHLNSALGNVEDDNPKCS
jgi:hypothetical protein